MTSTTRHPTLNSSVYRRILRRETHSPRAGLAIALAVVLILVLAWIGTESVLAFLSRPALLVAPGDALSAATTLPEAVVPATIIGGGAVLAVIGLIILLFALLPGRRARHIGVVDRTAVVVDNTVIASALARTASYTADIDPDQVVVTIGRRTAEVSVRPTSGFAVDRAAIAEAVAEQLEALNLTPTIRSKVVIEKKGVVGA
ncbi:hypothetical protein B0I08_11276 [Glaciihabitans tibetensis]|uniref:Alkaline shock family protein YloU n=1 Tax=Glaciihabitans tibetensis TaxID=1266600 RepID=A0A2T0V3F5_9MICO|nr:DUF6286 domain-containing protein [Glaciihabitans tibetensis]PRY64691.1 hypothetical protein B0I08_11276 [Glaciihabitans tibetensis]